VKRRPEKLADREFDILVIGGGITGGWLAFDCASRGLSVALIEKGDFGEATSAKSSKLLHGGIRYLQQLDFAKVRESALERAVYQRVAPHLTNFVPFLVPTYRTLPKGRSMLCAGMALYRLLCQGENRIIPDTAKRIPRGGMLSREEVLRAVPIQSAGVTGGYVFYESHMENSERMTLAVVKSAARAGAVCANYMRADGFLESDRVVCGVAATDLETGARFDIRARVSVNAAGPWSERLNGALGGGAAGRITGFSQGSHLVTRQLIERYAIAIPTRYRGANVVDRGGRHIFILPWRGYSLIGPSYVAAGSDLDRLSSPVKSLSNCLARFARYYPRCRWARPTYCLPTPAFIRFRSVSCRRVCIRELANTNW
jgi:glycerol-3-phosphate dehydrogenase